MASDDSVAQAEAMPGPTVELTSGRVLLRPFRPAEVDAIVAGRAGADELAQPEGPPNARHVAGVVKRSGRFVRGVLDLAIESSGRLIGDIQARGGKLFPAGVYEIGILVYAESDRGKGYGSEAIRLLADWLFEYKRAARLQAGTAVSNHAMRRTLERLGFSFEGVMRAFFSAAGSRGDSALYALTRDDWLRRSREVPG